MRIEWVVEMASTSCPVSTFFVLLCCCVIIVAVGQLRSGAVRIHISRE